jgi:hypothetical protein
VSPILTAGVDIALSAINSRKAAGSCRTSLTTNSIPFCERNPFACSQGAQSGWE